MQGLYKDLVVEELVAKQHDERMESLRQTKSRHEQYIHAIESSISQLADSRRRYSKTGVLRWAHSVRVSKSPSCLVSEPKINEKLLNESIASKKSSESMLASSPVSAASATKLWRMMRNEPHKMFHVDLNASGKSSVRRKPRATVRAGLAESSSSRDTFMEDRVRLSDKLQSRETYCQPYLDLDVHATTPRQGHIWRGSITHYQAQDEVNTLANPPFVAPFERFPSRPNLGDYAKVCLDVGVQCDGSELLAFPHSQHVQVSDNQSQGEASEAHGNLCGSDDVASQTKDPVDAAPQTKDPVDAAPQTKAPVDAAPQTKAPEDTTPKAKTGTRHSPRPHSRAPSPKIHPSPTISPLRKPRTQSTFTSMHLSPSGSVELFLETTENIDSLLSASQRPTLDGARLFDATQEPSILEHSPFVDGLSTDVSGVSLEHEQERAEVNSDKDQAFRLFSTTNGQYTEMLKGCETVHEELENLQDLEAQVEHQHIQFVQQGII